MKELRPSIVSPWPIRVELGLLYQSVLCPVSSPYVLIDASDP